MRQALHWVGPVKRLPVRISDRARKSARLTWGRLTAAQRPQPDFILIGTMRGGTTSLFRDLCAHPQMLAPLRKEIHYLDYHHADGERWYLAHFPTRRRRGAVARRQGHAITGEATSSYLAHPHAPLWAAAELPHATYIVLLRDPVDRAFSHWKLMTRRGYEKLDFAEAIECEHERIAREWERMMRDPHYVAVEWFQYSYVAMGHYAEQLERWFDAVGRDRIIVVRSEDYFAHPDVAWTQVTRFVGLSSWHPDSFSNLHSTTSGGLDTDVAARLKAHFAPHNDKLARLLGADVGWDS